MSYRIVCTFISCSLWASMIYGQAKKNENAAAVMDFTVISGIDDKEGRTLSESFRSSVIKANEIKKSWIILTRNEMDKILKEEDFSMSDHCDAVNCAVLVGQKLSAAKIITGSIGKVGETYSITARIIDVKTSEERAVNQKYSGSKDGLFGVFDEIANDLMGVKKSRTWWYVAGAALVGGGGAAALILGGKKGTTVPDLPGTPPGHP